MGYGRVDERTGYGSRPPHDARGDSRFQGYYTAQPHDSGYGVPDQRAWEPAQAQADQVRAQAQQEAQRFQAEFDQRRRQLEAELADRRQRGEAEVNETVAWAERVRSETEAHRRQAVEHARASVDAEVRQLR